MDKIKELTDLAWQFWLRNNLCLTIKFIPNKQILLFSAKYLAWDSISTEVRL